MVTALMLAGGSLPGRASAADGPAIIPPDYGTPAQQVTIGPGRTLNLRCSGSGPTTVLLEAGAHADASTWFRLQPRLAKSARVCAYDRAGYGFSPAGPLPRDLQADVADLHALIAHARLATPLVLVGHSLGSNIVRRYAQTWPADVAGMVLIDPPAQDMAAFAPAWAKDEEASSAQRDAFIDRCRAAAEKGSLPAAQAPLGACVAASSPLADPALFKAMNAYKTRPGFWRTLQSELADNAKVFAAPVSPDERHGAMPLIVLSAGETYADAPADVRPALEQARAATQAAITASSTRGERWPVAGASHDIQLDRPDVVARAVNKVLREMGPSRGVVAPAPGPSTGR